VTTWFRQFQSKLVGMRNYRASFIDGTSNVKTFSFKEHASTDMHVRAMHLFKKQQSTNVFEYAPIARALTQQATNTLAVGAWCLTNYLSVRTKCTLTGHSVWTLPKNYFEHCHHTLVLPYHLGTPPSMTGYLPAMTGYPPIMPVMPGYIPGYPPHLHLGIPLSCLGTYLGTPLIYTWVSPYHAWVHTWVPH